MNIRKVLEDYILMNYSQYYYEGKPTQYYISDCGDVYSFNTHKYLSKCIDTSGRYNVGLYIDGKTINRRIHRMVFETYVGEIPEGYTINHIDENFCNNYYKNLELMTHKENTLEYLKNHPDAFDKKYPDELIHEICQKLKSGIYYRKLANEYNLPISFISNIIRGRTRINIVSQYLPFPESAIRYKIDRTIDKKNIQKLIIDGKSNKEIRDILGMEDCNATNKVINKVRKIIDIPEPRYFDKEFIKEVENCIKAGMSNSQIVKKYKLSYDKRLQWLFARTRKTLNIPDFNENGISIIIQNEISKMISDGKSNADIIKKYKLVKNQYIINMLGRLRQKVKK